MDIEAHSQYVSPRELSVIESEIKALEQNIMRLLKVSA
jgi:hypothetical protein